MPPEPLIARGLWFLTHPREGGLAVQLPSPRSNLPTLQHSRMFWFAFIQPPPWGTRLPTPIPSSMCTQGPIPSHPAL